MSERPTSEPSDKPASPDGSHAFEPDANGEHTESDFSQNLSEEFRESFLGEEAIDRERRSFADFALSAIRITLRLLFPRANQIVFSIGFWILRAVGLAIILSWLTFGIATDAPFDRVKLRAGIAIALIGPLVLRAVEFLLENVALRGASPGRWRDFWSFRRMMTPRSIQTVFFVGFWALVAAGVFQIGGGIKDIMFAPQLHEKELAEILPMEALRDPAGLIDRLRNDDDPQTQNLLDLLPAETRRMLRESDTKANEQSDPLVQRMMADIYTTLGRLMKESPDATGAPRPFSRILRGLLLLVFGPMALRFTCESIILFFRINETLTDISRQIERANRRLAERDTEKRD